MTFPIQQIAVNNMSLETIDERLERLLLVLPMIENQRDTIRAAIDLLREHPSPPTSRMEAISAAILAALGCTKIDYRSGAKMNEAANQIATFVEDALVQRERVQ